MYTRKLQVARFAALIMLVFGICATVCAQNNNVDLRVGDVLAAVGNGTYQVYRPPLSNSSNPIGSIQSGAGDTRGCGLDSSYHAFTTDLTNNLVRRWNVNSVPASGIPNQVISAVSAAGESVAFDSLGNSYVGQPGGNGCVLKFGVTGASAGNLPLSCSNNSTIKGGTAWIDLSPDAGTIYFGNGSSKTVSLFSASCTKSPAKNCVSTFGPNLGTVFGVRVLPGGTQGSVGSPYLLAAAGSQVALLDGSGNLLRSYTATGEKDFEVLTLLPGTQFSAGSPANHKIYVFDEAISTPLNTHSTTSGPAGMCTYGLADAAQPQPQLATVLSSSSSPGVANLPNDGTGGYTPATAAFSFASEKLKVTFQELSGPGTLTARVTPVNPGSVLSDPSVTSSNSGLPEGGNFACTPDPTTCYVWEVEPSGITFSFDDISISRISGPVLNNNVHLLKNEGIDITSLTGNVDPAGLAKLSVYSINNFVPNSSSGTDVVCPTGNSGYLSPVVAGEVYNFGSVVPFKFQVAASLADCTAGNFATNLGNSAYLALAQADTINSAQAPVIPTVDVSGNSGPTPVYRLSTNQYIINVDTSNLVPGACYVASTFAPAFTSFNTTFCLTQ